MSRQVIPVSQEQCPAHLRANRSALTRWIGRTFYRSIGWNLEGSLANTERLLVVAAPHTSNWDFIVGLPIILTLGIKGSIMMKKEAFIWPLSYLWRWIGFIPIDRHSPKGAVGTAVEYFENNEAMWFVMSPEGTRSKIKHWRSGFLNIAHQANVPILLVSWDFPTKTVKFGRVMRTSGDYEKDMLEVREYFSQFTGKRPENH